MMCLLLDSSSQITNSGDCVQLKLQQKRSPDMSNDTKYPLSSKATRLKIELGKRYVRRDGKISGNIQFTQLFPYLDPDNDNTYDANGRLVMSDENPEDLIEEYVEPAFDLKDVGLLDKSSKVEAWAVKSAVSDKLICCGDTKPYYEREFKGYDVKIIKLREVTDEI